jgi:RHS repeat-associated protein
VALKAIEVGVYGDVALTLGGSGTSFTTAESGLALTGGVGTPQGPGYAYVYTLSYDRVGNIASSNDAYNGSWNYSYDPLNRLTKESATGYETPGFVTTAGKVNYQCWNYDNFGNRTFELDSSSTCPTSPLTQATSTHFASYNVSNQITGSDTEVNGPIYDAAGNVIQDALNNYLYDAKGRLCAVENLLTTSATEYVYDADGNRVAKGNWTGISWPTAGNTWAANAVPNCSTPTTANGFTLTAVYLRGAGGTQDLEIDSAQGSTPAGWRQNVFADGGLLATYQQSGTSAPALYFDFNDWLGTKRLVVNAAGQAVNYWGSDPFGDYLTPHVTTDPSDLHFTGKERDAESGLDYFGARYYGSNMGRFMSPDWSAKAEPVPYSKLDDPQTLNLYAYVGNNPLSRVDPDGHAPPPQYDVDGNQIQRDYGRFDPPHCICGPPPKLPNGNPAPPNVPVPGAPGAKWVWNPDSGNSRGGTWGPDQWDSKTNGPSKPSASWDDEDGKKGKDHWDVDDGKGSRGRYGEDGRPMTPDEAHGRGGTQTATPMSVTPQQAGAAAKGVAWGVIIYWTVSEGSRILFPPRNLVPVP